MEQAMVAEPIRGAPRTAAPAADANPPSEGGAVASFDVESYTVVLSQIGTEPPGAWRNLTLTSPALAHGIRHHASIFFFPDPPPGTIGGVSNVDQPNYQGHSVRAFLRKPDFAAWYDVLRNEQPLKFDYAYDATYDPSRPTRALFWVQLYTGLPEPPGEGPEDLQAKLFPADALDLLRKAQGSV
jgi:hypothetical protein